MVSYATNYQPPVRPQTYNHQANYPAPKDTYTSKNQYQYKSDTVNHYRNTDFYAVLNRTHQYHDSFNLIPIMNEYHAAPTYSYNQQPLQRNVYGQAPAAPYYNVTMGYNKNYGGGHQYGQQANYGGYQPQPAYGGYQQNNRWC